MPFKPLHLLLPLLGVALGVVSPWSPPEIVPVRHSRLHGRAAQAQTPAQTRSGVWGDARFLESEMEKACVWAKTATGVAFVKPPTAVPSDAATVAAFLREDYDAAFRRMGAADDEAVAAMARMATSQLAAAYDPKTNVVHVLPENARAALTALGKGGPQTEDVLQLLLVRMAVIAQDRQIFPEWKTALDGAESLDALHTAGAVLQGHAQYITQRVARQWNKDRAFPLGAFDDLVALLTYAPADASPAATALNAEVKFAVIQGLEFMALAARKPRPGIAGLLKSPPKARSAILDPTGFFDALSGRVSANNLPGQVRETFQKTLWAEDGWTVAEAEIASDGTEALLAPLEKMMYSTVLAGFERGKTYTATKDGVTQELLVLEFRKPGLAEAFVNLRKGAVERAQGKTEAGAGRDGGLHGFTANVPEGEGKQWMQWTYEGSYALGILTPSDLGDPDTRESWDDALEAAAEVVAKAESTRENRRLNKGR